MYTDQFITERSYLKGVSQATIQWYQSSFKAFEGALGSKQAIIERIGALRKTNSAISVNTYLRCLNAYFRWRHEEAGTTSARAAIVWVRQRPSIASTIIGARTIEQLDDNLGALDTQLTPEQIKTLDEVSQPKLNFPYDFVRNVGGFGYNGSTIDGITAPANPLSPQNDQERY